MRATTRLTFSGIEERKGILMCRDDEDMGTWGKGPRCGILVCRLSLDIHIFHSGKHSWSAFFFGEKA